MKPPRQAQWSDAVEQALAGLLVKVQGPRQARLLTLEQVRQCVTQALSAEAGVAWCHGGQSGDVRGLTTVCLCVPMDLGVRVGLSAARAHDVSPARAFRDLPNWDRYDDALNRAAALRWGARAEADRVLVPWASVARPDGPAAYLQAIAEAPGADEPRLVYADWLSERGDPRGEFISVQCALARGVADVAEASALRERERQLLAAHSDDWLAGLPRGGAVVHRFERGFVSMLRVTAADAVASLGPLVEREGVWRLVLECPVPSSLLVASWLPQLRALEVWGHGGLSAVMLEQLLSTRALAHLEALLIREQQPLGERGIATLAERGSAVFSSLRQLQLDDAQLTSAQLKVLADQRWFTLLKSLSLVDNPALGSQGAVVLASKMKHLQTLRLDGTRLGNLGLKILASSEWLADLSWLSVDRNRVTAEGAKALLESTGLRSLRRVSVDGNHLGRAMRARLDAKFLLSSPFI